MAAANAPRTVVVLALPSSQPRETLQHSQLLQTLDHFIGRKDALREPVEQDEVFKVIQRRLLEKMPDDAVAGAAAAAYQQIFTQMTAEEFSDIKLSVIQSLLRWVKSGNGGESSRVV